MLSSRTARVHGLLVLLTASLLAFLMLGRTGFASGEGTFVFPGWEMLEREEWVVPRLFGMVDLRSGVLVSWLQGGVAWVFGQSEFVARGVPASAFVVWCLTCFTFAQRWFGAPWGLVAGLSACVVPVWWWEGRSADPAIIHAMFTVLAVCLVIDRALARRQSTFGAIGTGWGLALAVAGMFLTSGPAGAPVLIAVLAALLLTTRRLSGAFWPATLLMLSAGTVAWGAWVMAAKSALVHETVHALPPVKQGTCWEPETLARLQALSWAPFYACLLWMPWRSTARGVPLRGSVIEPSPRDFARTLAWTCVLALAFLLATGAKDMLPALALLPLCIAAAIHHTLDASRRAGTRALARPRVIARVLFVVLLAVTVALTLLAERGRHSPKADAQRLGDVLQGQRAEHRELWAEGVAMDSPEVLRYACDRAFEHGQWITPRWKHRNQGDPPNLPPENSYLVVRTQERVRANVGRSEWPDFDAAGVGTWPLVMEGTTHNWVYRVYQSPAP